MWVNTNNNEIIRSPKTITINNVQYPKSIFNIWTNQELLEIGIKPFQETSYESAYYNATGYSDEEVDGVIIRTYNLEPKTSEEEIVADKLIKKKNQRINEIDQKSIELLENGFIYNGEVFDILNDEERWKELLLAATSNILPYPKTIYSKDKVGVQLNDLDDVKTFCATFMIGRESVLDPGRVLKEQIMACATQGELDLIEDNRQ